MDTSMKITVILTCFNTKYLVNSDIIYTFAQNIKGNIISKYVKKL